MPIKMNKPQIVENEISDNEPDIDNNEIDDTVESTVSTETVDDITIVNDGPTATGATAKTLSPEEIEFINYVKANQTETPAAEVVNSVNENPSTEINASTDPAAPSNTDTTTDGSKAPENEPTPEEDENQKTVLKAMYALALTEGLEGEAALNRAKQLYTIASNPEKNEAKKQQEQKQEQRHPGGGGGGGSGFNLGIGSALSSLIGGVINQTTKSVKMSAGVVGNRILQHHANELEIANGLFNESRKKVETNLNAANKALKDSLGGQAITELAEKNNLSFEDQILQIQNGTEKSAGARAAYHSATSDQTYNNFMNEAEAALHATTLYGDQTLNKFEKINNTFADKIDSEGLKNKITSDFEKLDELPKPLAGTASDPEKNKKFAEEIEKMTERLREMMEKIINKISQFLGLSK